MGGNVGEHEINCSNLKDFNVNIEVTRNTLKKLYTKLPSD
jgi:hypothetical protein